MDLLCEKDDCENEATFRYRWPWGDEGTVCDYHATTTQQLAQQLGREPALVSLGVPREAAPTGSELELAKQLLLDKDADLQEVTRQRDRLADENIQLVHALQIRRQRGATE